MATITLASALLAGCGGGSGDRSDAAATPAPTSSSSPVPERVYTVQELAAALPSSDQVPTGDRKTASCPGGDSCHSDAASVTVELKRPVDATEQERLAAKEFSKDFVQITATASADDAASATSLAKVRDVAGRYVGTFDLPAKKTSDTSYTPSEKGQGTLEDLTLAGWKGFLSARDVTFADPGGDGSTYPYQSTQVHLVKGSTLVSCYVTVLSEARGAGAATEIARRLATEYIRRLG